MTSSPESLTTATLPAWARTLGYAGLIPFVVAAAAIHLLSAPSRAVAAQVLLAYGATITAFLGGIHWGLAFSQAQPKVRLFAWGVVPSLVAWVALLMPAAPGLIVLADLVVVCYAVDRRIYRAQGLTRWLPLRLHLSAGAALSCLAGALGL